ncbi:sulfatase [Pedobacter sp. SD-b]|uniref:Sulfatase n=1 Tax=Pedobacter segetis TaxID=2793069 RepID=A0ABS1BMD3_9SPHI|nr:sulfatase [Pedobacter segetis]MBK0384052.1 sulfatase [Pedobacter segetis]
MTFKKSAFILFFTIAQGFSAFSQQPNILFAISDDQSFAHTSYAGCTFVNTPAFDRLAKEGCYFPNAYVASPGCAPSRGAIITGRYPWQNEQAGQHASSWPKKYIPFVDLLQKAGYDIGRTGKGVDPFQYARNEKDSLWRMGNAAGPSDYEVKFDNKNVLPAKGISNTNYSAAFQDFIKNRKNKNKPFFFWYGSHEPHRGYEKGSWKRNSKKLSDVIVPSFLPDNEVIRGDLLDYAVEIEWFDHQLDEMIAYLKKIGEYDNTIIIVTSDNGMPFPRTKANCYEYGIHVPLAIKFAKNSPFNGKKYTENVSLTQIAPTVLELFGVSNKGMLPLTGKSLIPQLKGKAPAQTVFSSRERHSSSRYLNWGYPQRAVVDKGFLLIWNMKPNRWPAGAPQSYDAKDSTRLLNMYSLDKNGKYTEGEIFADVDASPSKTYLIENHAVPQIIPYFNMAFDFRPEFELYNIKTDPDCIHNLYNQTAYTTVAKNLYQKLLNELRKTKDPRVGTKNPEIFDSYLRYMDMRYFPKPDKN